MGGGTDSMQAGRVPDDGLSIAVLGRGAVTIDGSPVRFATRHAELFVYLLALAGPEGLPRDSVIAALWPDVEILSARPRLRTALWQVRRALGDHAWRVGRERGVVMLDLEGVALDLPLDRSAPRSELLVGWNFTMPETLVGRVA